MNSRVSQILIIFSGLSSSSFVMAFRLLNKEYPRARVVMRSVLILIRCKTRRIGKSRGVGDGVMDGYRLERVKVTP